MQDFLQSLNARFITSDRAETKLLLTCLKRVSSYILHPCSARICACIDCVSDLMSCTRDVVVTESDKWLQQLKKNVSRTIFERCMKAGEKFVAK